MTRGKEDHLRYIAEHGGDAMRRGIVYMVCMALFFGMFIIQGKTAAFDPNDLQRLLATKSCPNCDLSNADLSGANLTFAYMAGANLSGANLARAYISWGNLSNADLGGANLTVAFLGNTNLAGANLSGANLTRANLAGVNLSGATWTDGSKCREGSVGECIR